MTRFTTDNTEGYTAEQLAELNRRFDAAVLDEVGPFDERYFLFSEEVDWMRRATDARWKVVFTPVARCAHVA